MVAVAGLTVAPMHKTMMVVRNIIRMLGIPYFSSVGVRLTFETQLVLFNGLDRCHAWILFPTITVSGI